MLRKWLAVLLLVALLVFGVAPVAATSNGRIVIVDCGGGANSGPGC